jgi:hypothetical protein
MQTTKKRAAATAQASGKASRKLAVRKETLKDLALSGSHVRGGVSGSGGTSRKASKTGGTVNTNESTG